MERLKKFARLILKMRLVEVSLVAVPANPKARAIRWYVEKALAEFEKAGRKISTSRLARLKKLLEELKGFIDEVDEPAPSEKKASEGESPPDKLAEIEGTVAQIAKTLGIAQGKDGEKKPALPETVENLAKRLDALEKAPGARTSLGGQEALADEGDSKSVWKGLI